MAVTDEEGTAATARARLGSGTGPGRIMSSRDEPVYSGMGLESGAETHAVSPLPTTTHTKAKESHRGLQFGRKDPACTDSPRPRQRSSGAPLSLTASASASASASAHTQHTHITPSLQNSVPAASMAPSRAHVTSHWTTTTLSVSGMTCGACTSAVESAFHDTPGVGNVSVSLVMERAVVSHDANLVSAAQIREMIEDRGFDAEVISSDLPPAAVPEAVDVVEGEEEMIMGRGISTTTIHVGGMTCGACTSAVEGAFSGVAGVKSFSISLLAERCVIEHDTNVLSAAHLAEIIEDTGFDAEVIDTEVGSEPASTALNPGRKGDASQREGSRITTTTVAIEGMTCGACTSAVEGGFAGDLPGLLQFNISLLAERAVILHDPSMLSVAKILEIIEDRGFDASLISSTEETSSTSALSPTTATIQLKIYGLPSPESAQELQSTLQSHPGIATANLNFSTTRATITHNPSQLGLRAIIELIESHGYNALVADSDDNNAQLQSLAKTREIQNWWRAFRVSLTFAIPVLLISMIIPMFLPFLDFGSFHFAGIWLGDLLCLLLTVPVQFGIGRRFYVSAWKSLKHGSPTMDVLVVLGTSAAFFFSVAAMIVSVVVPPHSRPSTTFDTSTMLITFIVLGRFLENRAKGETSKALSRLMGLAPSSAVIYRDPIAAIKAAENSSTEGSTETKNEKSTPSASAMEERTVPTELLEVGDIVILHPGDKIPADGTVLRGSAYVDESMVTGEAMPVLKNPGALLMAGTVNGSGRVDFRVTRAGRDTQLSQIVRLVQEAQTSRAPIQRTADVVAGYFVPIIITLGLATFVGWMLLSHLMAHPPAIFEAEASGGRVMVCVKLCIAVVVFACPCALGLATPTAVMVGTGVGAQQGILVKGGGVLERATKVGWVVLDKTGTLTMGKMSVAQVEVGKEWKGREDVWWRIVGLAEGGSEHPIAKAVVTRAKERLGSPVEGTIEGVVKGFKAEVGKGLQAEVDVDGTRYPVLIGNASLLRGNGVDVPLSPEDEYAADRRASTTLSRPSASTSSESARITSIHIAISATYAGSLALSDTLKPSARATITALTRLGIRTSLVTGDQPATAHHVASLLGIDPENVAAAVLPAGKQAFVENIQRQGYVVAMVGDGINDSPALATADIGISLSSGTDVAMEAADIVLMRPTQLLDIPASLHLSKTIFRRIKLNLGLSCVYNVVGLPIAMGFLLPWGISLPPLAAGGAMAASSVTVVVSSLMLKSWRRPGWMIDENDGEVEGGKKEGIWRRIGGLRDLVRRRRGEGERGAYVALENYEAV